MKKIIVTSYITMLALAASAQQTIVITGHVTGPATEFKKVYIQGDGVQEDSTRIENGTFTFRIPFKGPVIPYMHSEYDMKVRGAFRMAGLVIDRPGQLIIDSIDLSKGMRSGIVKGMPSAIDFVAWEKKFEGIRKAVVADLPAFNGSYDSPEFEAHLARIDSAFRLRISPVLIAAAKENSTRYAFAVALDIYGRSASTEDLTTAYQSLSKELQNSAPGLRIRYYLEGLKNSVMGNTVADFTLNGPDGKTFTFNHLKGKYVMIDFWASWCVPCRESFPRMRQLYEKYKGSKFELISVSIDRKKPDWDKAVIEEKLPWPQMLDTKSIAQRQFAVTAVPTAYLISPDGKIILKEIGFEEGGVMEKKLEELFR